MASMQTIASALFKVSAVLNALSVPGHIVFGWKALDPFLATHESDPSNSLAIASSRVGWDHMTVGILAAGEAQISKSLNDYANSKQQL